MFMDVFSKNELLSFNELMLGRGRPVVEDGIGYNKGDFGACSTYFNALSDAQYADLAKRLVKYTKTQLKVDKEKMEKTAEYLARNIKGSKDRSNGISIQIGEKETLICFRYNETFVHTVKNFPSRRWNGELENWVVPNSQIIQSLRALEAVGGDVTNAIDYVYANAIPEEDKETRTIVNCESNGEDTTVTFAFNSEIVSAIKSLPKNERKYNPENKSWTFKTSSLSYLTDKLKTTAKFKGGNPA